MSQINTAPRPFCMDCHAMCWWWTGKPGVLRFMGSQRVRHNWVTELDWTELSRREAIKVGWCGAWRLPTGWCEQRTMRDHMHLQISNNSDLTDLFTKKRWIDSFRLIVCENSLSCIYQLDLVRGKKYIEIGKPYWKCGAWPLIVVFFCFCLFVLAW